MNDAETFRQLIIAINALIGGLVILFGVIANRGRQHAKAARWQVQNDHPTNLRDEQDSRNSATVQKLDLIISSVESLGHDVGGIREELRALRRHDEATDERLLELERTHPRPPAPPKRRTR